MPNRNRDSLAAALARSLNARPSEFLPRGLPIGTAATARSWDIVGPTVAIFRRRERPPRVGFVVHLRSAARCGSGRPTGAIASHAMLASAVERERNAPSGTGRSLAGGCQSGRPTGTPRGRLSRPVPRTQAPRGPVARSLPRSASTPSRSADPGPGASGTRTVLENHSRIRRLGRGSPTPPHRRRSRAPAWPNVPSLPTPSAPSE